MKFGKAQQKRFGTMEGAYSVVTTTEYKDSQITFTDYEADLVISHYGEKKLLFGNVKSNKAKASKTLRLFPSGDSINLNVVFPKPEKWELRLYLSSTAGFKPQGGEIWFIYKKKSELWIGSMTDAEWRKECSALKDDETDAFYQESLDEADPAQIMKLAARDVYKRDRSIALKRIKLAGYVCEFDSKHKLFMSRFSGMPYLESHHLIPIGLQSEFRHSLDTIHNVFCLCPFCHRAVHHAETSLARNILEKLASRRSVLGRYSIDVPDLLRYYAVEKIERAAK